MSWTSTEKKPDRYLTVIIYPGCVTQVGIGFYGSDDRWFDIEGLPNPMATPPRWWMSLPDPPVGG